jgi:Ca2+-binding EF-hand superfamily protein
MPDIKLISLLLYCFPFFPHSFDSSGHIKTEDLGTVLRGLGHNLTETAIHKLINLYDSTGSGQIDFEAFHELMTSHHPLPSPANPAQIEAAFACFDMYEQGSLSVAHLVHILRNRGEPLSVADIKNLLREIYVDGDNNVHIQDMIKHMVDTSAPNPQ